MDWVWLWVDRVPSLRFLGVANFYAATRDVYGTHAACTVWFCMFGLRRAIVSQKYGNILECDAT